MFLYYTTTLLDPTMTTEVAATPAPAPPVVAVEAKTEATDAPVAVVKADPQVLKNVAERLSFFFSNANVRVDRFLQKSMGRENDYGGSVGVDALLKFKSIQQYTDDKDVILQAAKSLDFLTVKDEDGSICVTKPMTKDQLNDNIPLSLHVEGLPVSEENKYTVSVADLKPLFEEYGSVALIKLKWKPAPGEKMEMGKKRKMVPTGSCLVEYSKLEDVAKAEAALLAGDAADKKVEQLKIKDSVLTVQKLVDWIAARKAAKGPREEKKENGDDIKKDNAATNGDSSPDKKRKEFKEFTVDWKKGCVICLTGLDAASCDREAITAAVAALLGKPYIDYSRGQTDGAIRCPEPNDAMATLVQQLTSGDVQIAGAKVGSAKILEGEEEEAYWNKFIAFKNKQLQEKQGGGNRNQKRQRQRR